MGTLDACVVLTPRSAASSELPHLPGLERAEALGGDAAVVERGGERRARRVDRLIGELERAVMVRERELGAAFDERLHRLLRVHVLVAHEPARLVGADRQDGEAERAVERTGFAETEPGAVAGIGNVVDAA